VQRLLVITNSAAGSSDEEPLEAALSVLRAGADVVVTATSSPDELEDVLAAADGRRIVVAGGDGSLHAVVAAAYARGSLAASVLSLIPLGTGNDFARGTSIPLDPAQAAHLALSATPRPVDLIVDDTGSVVVNNVHAGIGAQASRKAGVWKDRLGTVGLGKLGYPAGAVLSVFKPPVRLRVTVDGEVVVDRRRVLQISLGNGSRVGGGTELNPGADPTDGGLDVMVSRAMGPLRRLSYVVHLRQGEHLRRDDVLHLTGSEVTVDGDEFWISADGEIDGPVARRSWRLERGAYLMTLPD
jgi:diacylglycerol kinase family enzyme